MPVLLDTNALLWTLDLDARLGRRAREAAGGQGVVVSVVSLWEIQLKVAVGKLAQPVGLSAALGRSGVRRLAIEDSHLVGFSELPVVHRDPFDRMLIAQAQAEGLMILTSDAVFTRYDVQVLDARS